MPEDLRVIDAQVANLIEPKPPIPDDAYIDTFLAGSIRYSPRSMWWLGFDYECGDRAEWYPLSASTVLDAAMSAYEEYRKQRQNTIVLSVDEMFPAWHVEILFDGQPEAVEIYADTLALAICQAIIEAAKREYPQGAQDGGVEQGHAANPKGD